jgi:uncharacterized membrane protein YbhN (UPF0104 family)
MSRPATGRTTTALKAAFTLLILAVVLTKVPLRELVDRMSRLRASGLLLLAAITTVQVTIAVVRWWRLLRRLDERVAFGAIFGDALVGLTYNMFLPTTVGGDVVRAIRCGRRVEKRHHAWSSSIYERIAGLLAMAASGAIGVAIGLGASNRLPGGVRVAAIAMTMGLLVFFFAASAPFRLMPRLLERRLKAAAEDIKGIAADLEGRLATAGARVEALGWSILYQALGVLFVVVGARGLGDTSHALAIVVGVPIVHVLSMIPITIGGLGLREGLFVAVLGALGVQQDVALGLAAQWLASSVAFALAGGVVALVTTNAPQSTTTK